MAAPLPEDRDALLRHYREMREALLAALEGITDAQLTERTLDGWSVKDHLLHLALWDDVRAAEVARIAAGHASAWRMLKGQDAVYSDLGHALRRDLSIEQARWELANSHRRLLSALERATPEALDGSRYGEAGLRSTHEAQHTGWILRWRGERGI